MMNQTPNRASSMLRKSDPLPPLKQQSPQSKTKAENREDLFAVHSIDSPRGMAKMIDDDEDDPLILENKELDLKVQQVTKENQEITMKFNEISLLNEKLTKEHETLETENKKQTSELTDLRKKNNLLNSELANVKLRMSKLPSNAEQTQRDNERLQQLVENLKAEIKKQEDFVKESRRCLQTKENQYHETDREKIKFTSKYSKYKNRFLDLEQRHNTMSAENERLMENERNREAILNAAKAEKDSIINDLSEKLTKLTDEHEKATQKVTKLSAEVENLNEQIGKYQKMIEGGLKGIDDTPENVEERDWRRAEKKTKAEELFARFGELITKEKDFEEKVANIQKELEISEAAEKLEISEKEKSLNKVDASSENKTTEIAEENKTTENVTENKTTEVVGENKTAETDKGNNEKEEIKIEHTEDNSINESKSNTNDNNENNENKENNNNNSENQNSNQNEIKNENENEKPQENQSQPSKTDLLRIDAEKAKKEFDDFKAEIESLKEQMIQFGVKPISFDKPEEPFTEEEDESDFTFTEIKNRVSHMRKVKNETLEELTKLKEEHKKLKEEYDSQKEKTDKISSIVDSLISKRVIQYKPPPASK